MRKVQIGNIFIGGNEKIAIQSMCNTKTTDIEGSIRQVLELEEYGCDIVRLSVPDKESALALSEIVKATHIPIVADIHFDYRLALMSADSGVSKIRINPGNIGGEDKVKYVADYLKERNIPIRIGVNGGSLEKEFQSLPVAEALCKSAIKHVRMLEKADFDDIVISVKSSNVIENIKAYRMLSDLCDYPLHLGVTEAGIYEVGVIKSAIGIGSLLADGIGSTIRVSLTDEPYKEVIVANRILQSLGMGTPHVEIISCPTCARTCIDVQALAELISENTRNINKNIKIAVMGCVVNGPGEAGHCDFGIAGGKDKSVIFSKGKILKTIDNQDIISEVRSYIDKL